MDIANHTDYYMELQDKLQKDRKEINELSNEVVDKYGEKAERLLGEFQANDMLLTATNKVVNDNESPLEIDKAMENVREYISSQESNPKAYGALTQLESFESKYPYTYELKQYIQEHAEELNHFMSDYKNGECIVVTPQELMDELIKDYNDYADTQNESFVDWVGADNLKIYEDLQSPLNHKTLLIVDNDLTNVTPIDSYQISQFKMDLREQQEPFKTRNEIANKLGFFNDKEGINRYRDVHFKNLKATGIAQIDKGKTYRHYMLELQDTELKDKYYVNVHTDKNMTNIRDEWKREKTGSEWLCEDMKAQYLEHNPDKEVSNINVPDPEELDFKPIDLSIDRGPKI